MNCEIEGIEAYEQNCVQPYSACSYLGVPQKIPKSHSHVLRQLLFEEGQPYSGALAEWYPSIVVAWKAT